MLKKALCIVLCLCILFAFPLFSDAKQDNDKKIRFNPDGSFKILQISDLQDDATPFSRTNEFLKACIEDEKPDLLVLTGDNIAGKCGEMWPVSVARYTVRKAIDSFMSVLNKFDIPIAVVFGNHDGQGDILKEEQMAIYNEYENCIAVDEGDLLYGCGTYNIPVYSSKSDVIKYNIWCFDSNMYDSLRGGYDYVHEDQVQWYIDTSNALKEQNGGVPVNSIVFQHIIVSESEIAVKEAGDKFIGEMHEPVSPPTYHGNQFEAMLKQGDVKAMFFGHDHVNAFICPYKGIDIVNSPSSGFGSYGNFLRGIRVITLDENDTSSYGTYLINYNEKFGKNDPVLRDLLYLADNYSPKDTGERFKAFTRMFFNSIFHGEFFRTMIDYFKAL